MDTAFTDSDTSGEENLIPEFHRIVHAHEIIKKREVFQRLKDRAALHRAFRALAYAARKTKAEKTISAFLSRNTKQWQTRRKMRLFEKYSERLYGVCGDSIESFLVAVQLLHGILDIRDDTPPPSLIQTINSVVQTPVRENFLRGMLHVKNLIDVSVLLRILCPNREARIVLWPLLSDKAEQQLSN